jgi:hypothetical protein
MTEPPVGAADGRESAPESDAAATPAGSDAAATPAGSDGAATPAGAESVNATALRLARTPMDMAKAVLILLVPVMIAVGVYVFFFGGSSPIVIDPSGSYSDARAAAVFQLVEPQGLSSGWKPVSSSYSVAQGRHVLRVGYIAPSGAGLQLVESDGPAASVISDEVGTGNPVGASVDIGGRTWGHVDAGSNSQPALIDVENGYTIIVKGEASTDDLRTFAAALR